MTRKQKLKRLSILSIILFGLVILAILSSKFNLTKNVDVTEIVSNISEEFSIIDIPPGQSGVDLDVSKEVFSIIDDSILNQSKEKIIPSILSHYKVKYIVFYNKSYTPLFEGYLENETDIDKFVKIAKVNPGKVKQVTASFVSLGGGWYEPEKGNGNLFQWMNGKAVVNYINMASGKNKIIKFVTKGILNKSSLLVTLNDTPMGLFNISKDFYSTFHLKLNLTRGKNQINFIPVDNCIQPEKDIRCLSFSFKEIEFINVTKVPEEGFISFENFYSIETVGNDSFNWMSTESVIRIFTLEEKKAIVKFSAISYAKPRNLSLQLNGKTLANYEINVNGTQIVIPFKLKEGGNEIVILIDGCDVPAIVENSDDKRCLSAKIKNANILQ